MSSASADPSTVDQARFARTPELLVSDLGGETVILDPRDGLYFGLNGVATRVWNLLAVPQTLSQLQATLAGEYDVAPDILGADLQELISSLKHRRLIEVADGERTAPAVSDGR